tara:strand:+ start:66720 stop:67337 length:618 start_codon:yes stop_codon:yes gene_type:complete
MTQTLYFHPLSGCSRRVLSFLTTHEIPFEPKHVALERGEQKQPDYLRLNPNGRVPTLVVDDQVIWESLAILRYLAETFAPAALGEGTLRCQVDQWATWGATELGQAISKLNAQTGLKAMRGQPIDADAVAEATTTLHATLAILEQQLALDEYLVGSAPTIADHVIAADIESCTLLAKFKFTEEQAKCAEWFARMRAMPGWPPVAA